MEKPKQGRSIILSREVEGDTELAEWFRHGDTVWLESDGKKIVIGPDQWERAWADLEARGFVEAYPTDQRKMAIEKKRVAELVRSAFKGVTLGDGVGLRHGQGLDERADEKMLAAYRALDETDDWSAIPIEDLDRYSSSLSFLDAAGMRFHLPAYLIASLEGRSQMASIEFHLFHFGYGAETRFALLTPAQRTAVREFLLLRLADAHHEFEHPMIEEALRCFWTASAEP